MSRYFLYAAPYLLPTLAIVVLHLARRRYGRAALLVAPLLVASVIFRAYFSPWLMASIAAPGMVSTISRTGAVASERSTALST